MPIREKGYYSWEGSLRESYIRWLPIFINGIKHVFRKKRSKLLFAFTSSTFFIFLLAIYVTTKPELKILTHLVKQIQLNDALIFKTYYSNGFLIFMMMIISMFSGAELIAGDIKHKSFTLYLSRPISKFDYIKGKISVVLFYLLLFSLVPGLLLILAKILFTGSLSVPFYIIFAALIFPVLVSLFMASLILMLSSLSANIKFVSILFIGFYLLSNMVAGIFGHALHNDYFYLLSIDRNIRQFAAYVFNTKPVYDAPPWLSGLILLTLTCVFLTILAMRIKRVEA